MAGTMRCRAARLCGAALLAAAASVAWPASASAGRWVRTGGPPGGLGYDVRIRPDRPETVYVTDSFSGVNVSTDGGRTWRTANEGIVTRAGTEWYVVAIDPADAKHVLGANNCQGVLLGSGDGGRTWRAVGERPGERMSWRAIAFAPSDPSVVYAGTSAFFSAGTFDDVTRRVTYLPLLEDSAFCAPCHYGVFWGVVVYDSYGEWLRSPYSDPNTGKTCQDCHMPPTAAATFASPEKGGLRRTPGRIFNHRMPGAADTNLLQDTARLTVRAARRAGRIAVTVRVTNEKAGHHIPTDHPARNILLVVSAADANGAELEHLGRQVLPDWAGEGRAPDDYAGRPGKGYAKVLEELWTEVAPRPRTGARPSSATTPASPPSPPTRPTTTSAPPSPRSPSPSARSSSSAEPSKGSPAGRNGAPGTSSWSRSKSSCRSGEAACRGSTELAEVRRVVSPVCRPRKKVACFRCG